MVDAVFVHRRILIVDDEEANARLMTRLLQRSGYLEVKALTDSRQALAVVRDWHPDLVMLDLHMPHIDGFSLLNSIRAAQSLFDFLPVIVLTADASHDALVKAMNAGANDFLTKPVDLDEVLLRVQNLLAFRISHQALKSSNSALALTLSQQMQHDDVRLEGHEDRMTAMESAVERGPRMVFQPIIVLETGTTVGVEALSRFDTDRPTDRWFAEAEALGLGAELELAAIRAAFHQLDNLASEKFMAVNASPAVMFDDRFGDLVRGHHRGRVVIEITEHRPVSDYEQLSKVCQELREDGVRLAIDDAGAGYASLRHILMLNPDIIKFDIALTHGIDKDPVKRALAASLLQFSNELNATVTAEGIESEAELLTLADLGVPWGQGFYIGCPGELEGTSTANTQSN
ncbi:MAG TPA: EAL domain-containing response regulator [Acidimicrobiales bacterium]|jgi:EAL domain-containing protein (putative c-di-GMP-specific phosphodiesterase class I)|nr:EAL domain-containing response regulator [Acidimicrobiales bacterium]